MRYITLRSLAASAALALGISAASPSAQATLTYNATVGGGALAGARYVNFDNLPTGSGGGGAWVRDDTGALVSGTVGVSLNPQAQVVIVPPVNAQYAPPNLSGTNSTYFQNIPSTGPDATPFITSGSTGSVATASATLDFSAFGNQSYLGILWGSVDSYNTLAFYDGATLVGTLTGGDILSPANGNQGVTGTAYVNIFSDRSFNKVVATSTLFAFEFDNVAFAVPEPSTTIAALSGIGILGLHTLRRRIRKAK